MYKVIHSGGAEGADHLFKILAEQHGYIYMGYYYGEQSQYNAPHGNIKITEELYQEGRVKAAEAAKLNWGYQYPMVKDFRLARNWAQIKFTDMVIAIGHIVDKGERVFPSLQNDKRIAVTPCVTGGTGYAVTMAILHNKPVYVYEQVLNQWCTYDYTDGWVTCDEPTLTNNFTGIGSRTITQQAVEAITKLFK